MATRGQKVSAAMKRFVCDDRDNEFYTQFRYSPVEGLGYEPGVGRRDPSTIIKVGDLYYVWYTKTPEGGPRSVGPDKATDTLRAFPWDLASVWYATSPDGHKWTEGGEAVGRGPKGAFDDRSVFTPDILVAEGSYYLVYQAVAAPYRHRTRNVVAMAKADSPDGPWEKLPEPVLRPGEAGEWLGGGDDRFAVKSSGAWDSHKVHDPNILVRDGKYWLYYKGQQMGKCGRESKWGVAISDRPEGPYTKSELNPITNSGHELWVWPYREGVAAILVWAGPEKNTIQYAPDGLNFYPKTGLDEIPKAGGAYIPDKFSNTKDGKGFTWGLSHHADPWAYLVRFECDLHVDSEKKIVYGEARMDAGRFEDVATGE